jgi:hypothetical protein
MLLGQFEKDQTPTTALIAQIGLTMASWAHRGSDFRCAAVPLEQVHGGRDNRVPERAQFWCWGRAQTGQGTEDQSEIGAR